MSQFKIKRHTTKRDNLTLAQQVEKYALQSKKYSVSKHEPVKRTKKNLVFGTDQLANINIKTEDNSIQDLINSCHPDIRAIIGTGAKSYKAESGILTIGLSNKMKVRIEYQNQPKVPTGKSNINYQILDRHNRVIG